MALFGKWRRGSPVALPTDELDLELTLAFLTAYGRSERRIGKVMSAANEAKIRAAIDVLKRLLAGAERVN